MKKRLYISFVFFIFCSCRHEESLVLGFNDTYTINAGKNSSSGIHVYPFTKKSLQFEAAFDKTAIYETKDHSNQSDINKLLGFSDCNSGHHVNSARFGWNWNDGGLNIYAYCYSEGVVKNKYITTIKIDTVYRYTIIAEKDKYVFLLDGKMIEMDRGCSQGFGYILFPYFGGTEKSPQNIDIKLRLFL